MTALVKANLAAALLQVRQQSYLEGYTAAIEALHTAYQPVTSEVKGLLLDPRTIDLFEFNIVDDAITLKRWDESKHPRGQPENAGEFGPGGGKSSPPGKKKEAKPKAEAKPAKQKVSHRANKKEHEQARKRAVEKIKNVPIPDRIKVIKSRCDAKFAARAGGESRGGSAKDRRQQRLNLFKEGGGEEKGYCVCACGLKMHWAQPGSDDNPDGYHVLERGKILVKSQGGGYTLGNTLAECFECNRVRNAKIVRDDNTEDIEVTADDVKKLKALYKDPPSWIGEVKPGIVLEFKGLAGDKDE